MNAPARVLHSDDHAIPPAWFMIHYELHQLCDLVPQFLDLSPIARTIFWNIRNYFGSNGEAFPSHQRLAHITGYHVDTVREALNRELIPQGWLTKRTQCTPSGRRNHYALGATGYAALATVTAVHEKRCNRVRSKPPSSRSSRDRVVAPVPWGGDPGHRPAEMFKDKFKDSSLGDEPQLPLPEHAGTQEDATSSALTPSVSPTHPDEQQQGSKAAPVLPSPAAPDSHGPSEEAPLPEPQSHPVPNAPSLPIEAATASTPPVLTDEDHALAREALTYHAQCKRPDASPPRWWDAAVLLLVALRVSQLTGTAEDKRMHLRAAVDAAFALSKGRPPTHRFVFGNQEYFFEHVRVGLERARRAAERAEKRAVTNGTVSPPPETTTHKAATLEADAEALLDKASHAEGVDRELLMLGLTQVMRGITRNDLRERFERLRAT